AADDARVVNALVGEVRRVVVVPGGGMAVAGCDRSLGRRDVEGVLRGVHVESEPDPHLCVGVEHRLEPTTEVVEAGLPVRLGGGREAVEAFPPGGPAKAVAVARTGVPAALPRADLPPAGRPPPASRSAAAPPGR